MIGEMDNTKKIDMSATCGLGQEVMSARRYRGEITNEQFEQWYSDHCAKCIHESVICMCGE